MAGQNAKGLKRIVNAFFFSIAGFKATWKHEEAFRQEVLLLMVAAPLALWITENNIEQVLLIGSVVGVLLVELLNSAVENVVDLVTKEIHPLAKSAKDIGATAVMFSIALHVICWILVILTELI